MGFQLKGRVVFFATNNVNKFNEARKVLVGCGIAVGMLRVKSLEVQSDSLEEIARASVVDAFQRCHLPVVVEDAGLFVEALGGFPGPYAAYVYKTVGNLGLLKLMEGVKVRRARFVSVVAYFSAELDSPVCFSGVAEGEIVEMERKGGGGAGFGFDPVFRPSGIGDTFAEMGVEEKNRFSHRADAFRKFGGWYKSI
jgi:XTP/dITP diphosphohydrolase